MAEAKKKILILRLNNAVVLGVEHGGTSKSLSETANRVTMEKTASGVFIHRKNKSSVWVPDARIEFIEFEA